MDNRPSWDDYFLSFLPIISQRATCDRGKSSCLIVMDKRIISTGYVGSITGQSHCSEVGHLMVKKLNNDNSVSEHCIRTVHAEQNAIAQAVKDAAFNKESNVPASVQNPFTIEYDILPSFIYPVEIDSLWQETLFTSQLQLTIQPESRT